MGDVMWMNHCGLSKTRTHSDTCKLTSALAIRSRYGKVRFVPKCAQFLILSRKDFPRSKTSFVEWAIDSVDAGLVACRLSVINDEQARLDMTNV